MKNKRFLSMILAAALILTLLPALPALAKVGVGNTFQKNGVNYRVTDEYSHTGEVEVIAGAYSGAVTIPDTVVPDGTPYFVSAIGADEEFSYISFSADGFITVGKNIDEYYRCAIYSPDDLAAPIVGFDAGYCSLSYQDGYIMAGASDGTTIEYCLLDLSGDVFYDPAVNYFSYSADGGYISVTVEGDPGTAELFNASDMTSPVIGAQAGYTEIYIYGDYLSVDRVNEETDSGETALLTLSGQTVIDFDSYMAIAPLNDYFVGIKIEIDEESHMPSVSGQLFDLSGQKLLELEDYIVIPLPGGSFAALDFMAAQMKEDGTVPFKFVDAGGNDLTDTYNCSMNILSYALMGFDSKDDISYAIAEKDDTWYILRLMPPAALTDDATGIQAQAGAGVLPLGTSLHVTQTASGANFTLAQGALGGGYSAFTLFDISLENGGEAVQPDGTVTVSFPVPSGYDASKCVLFYIAADGTKTPVEFTLQDGMLVAQLSHFSLYTVAQLAAGGGSTDKPESGGADTGGTPDPGSTPNPGTGARGAAPIWWTAALLAAGAAFGLAKRRPGTDGQI